MVVKNEDQWIWYAIHSVLPYVDTFLLYDTGSTDNTKKIIDSIKSKKIIHEQHYIKSPLDLTKLRQKQVDQTKTDWFWVIDGDEIYPQRLAEEVVDAVESKKYSIIAARRYDLLGDVYHRQRESVGQYNLYGHKGHLVTRLINIKKIKGLHLAGDYPNEGYFDKDGISTQKTDIKNVYITKYKLHHTMYLKRSSIQDKKMFNRGKYRIETGIKINTPLPSIFYKTPPSLNLKPLKRRGWKYELLASIITPIKNIKRLLLK